MSSTNISYEVIENALFKADAMTEPAEAHGTLCGMIAISGKGAPYDWLTHIFGEHDPQDLNIKEATNTLLDLHDNTLREIIDQDYELELVMHDDDTPLDIRVDDLAHWCQGFLFGLSMSGLKDIKSLPEDAAEVLQDMMDISKAGFSADDDDEENEQAFAEISEYIRIGAYVIYNTFNSEEMNNNSATIH